MPVEIQENTILYGMGAPSFADNPMFNMNMTEAEEFFQNYKKALPTLFQWENRAIARGKREGTVKTYFGRPRRVKGYLDNRQYAFAERTIVNTQVQGSASDILKIVLCKLWTGLFNNPEYKEDVAWRTTIHDEIQYVTRATRANEIGKKIIEYQTFTLPEWPVDIAVELSIGWTMGSLFAWEEDSDGWLKPKTE